MRGVIFLNGKIDAYNVIKTLIREGDVIFVADGGIRHVKAMGLEPAYIAGDFDSFDRSALKEFSKAEIFKFPPEKNYTDGELIVNKAIELGCEEVMIVGGLGGRIDHMMSNLALLRPLYLGGVNAYVCDEQNKIRYVESKGEKKSLWISKDHYQYLSIIPLSHEVLGVTLEGVKYPLKGHALEYGSTLCTSNEILAFDQPAKVEFNVGRILIIQSRED